jgi:hypothetical protein
MSFTVEAKLTENMSTSLLIGTQKSDWKIKRAPH